MEIDKIPYQENESGIVALLPDGRVKFLHPSAKTLIDSHNQFKSCLHSQQLDDYILESPYVELERFHLSAPAIAFIETTNLCNLQCDHCYAWSGYKRENEITTDRIKTLLDEFSEIGVLQVFLTGGEIFAHRDAIKIIKHARSKSFSTQIFSNGLLITEKILKQIPSGQSFFISFDTAVPERTVRGRMDFPKLRECFELMKKYGHVFRTAVSVHSQNIHDVEEIFEWCVENNYPRPQWLETHPIGRALLHQKIILQPNQIDEVFSIYERCMDRFHAKPDFIEPNQAVKNKKTPDQQKNIRGVQTIKFCQQLEKATNQEKCGRSVAYINSSGSVYPCSNCMSNDIHAAGNITETNFKDIWENGFSHFRDITFSQHSDCSSCDVQKNDIWCQFRCPPLAKNLSNNELGCGATEYLRLFMLKSDEYWKSRREQGLELKLIAQNN